MFYLRKNRNNVLRDIFNDDFIDDVFGVRNIKRNDLKADLLENENDYELKLEIPGLNKEDIKIAYEDSTLTISAEKKQNIDKSNEENNYVHKEIYYGAYSRSFHLENIDKNAINAKYENGILNIILPKKEINQEKKYITIE